MPQNDIAHNEKVILIELLHMLYNSALILEQYRDKENSDILVKIAETYTQILAEKQMQTPTDISAMGYKVVPSINVERELISVSEDIKNYVDGLRACVQEEL